MNESEAQAIISQIMSGKQYRTRFQEQEWGVYLDDRGTFIEWGCKADLSGRGEDSRFENKLDEKQVLDLFKMYDFKKTMTGIKGMNE